VFLRQASFLLIIILLATITSSALAQRARRGPRHLTISEVVPRGIITFGTGTSFMDTKVGGLSGITYDAGRDVYYALSDDRSSKDPARYYTIAINISEEGYLLDVTFLDVTFLRERQGEPFAERSLDPEGIELARPGQLFIASEGDASEFPPIDPYVNRFDLSGKQNLALPIAGRFLPDGKESYGVRFNRAFESLTSTPDMSSLYTATESGLIQDGPKPTLDHGSPARVLRFSQGLRYRQEAEYVYDVSPIPRAPIPLEKLAGNGLVELQALDNAGTFLAMERSFAVGAGNTVRLFETSTQGATDVSAYDSLPPKYEAMSKRLIADLRDLGYKPDNLEGMTFGPGTLPGGYRPLIIVSDNNFRTYQTTQFILLGVKLEAAAP
jgi:hypothetical protein